MKVLTADREREGKLDVEAANEAGTRKVFVPPPARSSPQLHPESASPSPPPAAHASLPFFLSVFHLLLAPVLFKAPPPPCVSQPPQRPALFTQPPPHLGCVQLCR